MEPSLINQFSSLSGKLCNLMYVKEYDNSKINALIDELNSKPYGGQLFVLKEDAAALFTTLCLMIKPDDKILATKASHLMCSIITKQNLQFDISFQLKVVSWHISCIKTCSVMLLLDILHNMQCIIQVCPLAASKVIDELIVENGLLLQFLNERVGIERSQESLQIFLLTMKCLCSVTSIPEDTKVTDTNVLDSKIKEKIAGAIINFLLKGTKVPQDEFLYCKIVIYALRSLAQLYFTNYQQRVHIPFSSVVGICRHYMLYGIFYHTHEPDVIVYSQQTIATPAVQNAKGGKKQRIRKQRNNAIESIKKDLPISDRSLMREMDNFDNNSAYKPVSNNYMEPQKPKNNVWPMTSDSDISDVESGKEAKLIALKSRVRQSASNLMLVLIKVAEKKDLIGYLWALLPECPNANNWALEESCKKTIAYAAVNDPIASSRTAVTSVMLALLSSFRTYFSQAEPSKEYTTSFISFSESLGYTITCLHNVVTEMLEHERNHSVILVTLKCCGALVQATPYHKMKGGLITKLVRQTRRFLLHREVTIQVGALITMGCILSVDPKVEETLKAMQKDAVPNKKPQQSGNSVGNDYCDLEEGYSDDEMFLSIDAEQSGETIDCDKMYFEIWILDVCFKNMGWTFKENVVSKCKPSAIPVVLESLQVVSAMAFHHFVEVLRPHMTILADILCEMMQNDHQEVILQAARTVSVVGDAMQKLENKDEPLPSNHCLYFWEKLLTPLAGVLQCRDNSPAKSVACDCIANIAETSFKLLPRRSQVLCCTLLMGSCSDEDPSVRAAAVRALAMLLMYRVLREDICFVSDCGENILRALSENTLVVRTKASWALGNLSHALVKNMEDADIDDIDDDLLLRLLEASMRCAIDNDAIKMSATRGIGNLLRLIKSETLSRNARVRALCEDAIYRLLDCASKVTNMKVRWNACYALGSVLTNEVLYTSFEEWQKRVFPSLCSLVEGCKKNFKVRITAAKALRAPRTRDLYGAHFYAVWESVMVAMETAAHVDDFTEYKHKDNLIEQLCVTLSHLCCLLRPSDMANISGPLSAHCDCAKALFTQLSNRLPPENESCLKLLDAAKYVTVSLAEDEQQVVNKLRYIFVCDF